MSNAGTTSNAAATLVSGTQGSRTIASPVQSVGLIHDLGNLIQIASSAVNMVARNPRMNTADLGSAIAGAKTSLERAGALVRQTIGMASERAAAGQQARVAACLAEIETLLRSTWGHGIRLDIHADPGLPAVACDPLALQSAVLNLLFNARDAMPDGGVIAVHAEALDADNGIELRVVDSGVGMKPETIARAFDPFFTTKCNGLGGVGLPMVERFAREIGGRVLIESEYGIGTTVKLQLPASSLHPGLAAPGSGRRKAVAPTASHSRLPQPEQNP